MEQISFISPNSDSEMKRVAKEFGLIDYKYVSVPNAVDITIFNENPIQDNKYLEFNLE